MGPGPERTVASRTAREEAEERALAAARASFPAWQIREAGDGYLAVPADAVVVLAMDLDGLVKKLREKE